MTFWMELASTKPGYPFLIPSNDSSLGVEDEHLAIQVHGTPVWLDLYYFPLLEIDRTALQHLLFNAQARFTREILMHGNGPLHPDPYQTPRIIGENATFTAKSMRNPDTQELNQMTFETVLNVAEGLFLFLFREKRRGSVIANVIDPRVVDSSEFCGTVTVRPYGDISRTSL
ncbi:hypothetical protein ACLMJK_005513 [Lecanora helva]